MASSPADHDARVLERLTKTAERLADRFRLDEAHQLLSDLELLGAKRSPELDTLDALLKNDNQRGVDFFVVGTQKGGTTALHEFFVAHPEVCMPSYKKELHYFDSGTVSPGHRDYHRYFFPEAGHRLLGEASPFYMAHPEAIANIRRYNAHARLIVLLRDPIERAVSHWHMRNLRRRPIPFDFDRALAIHRERDEYARFNVLRRGLYVPQLERICGEFPQEQVLILRSEELRGDHEGSLARVSGFLGISPFPEIEQREHRVGAYRDELSREDYLRMKAFFAEDVRLLSERFGIDTSGWMRRYD